jgi:tetratricopeptide (TPR) repeat protein
LSFERLIGELNVNETLRAVVLAVALGATGCMSWTPGWEIETTPSRETGADHAEVRRALDTAGNASELRDAIDDLQAIVDSEPDNLAALERLSEAMILYGAAYAGDRKEKASWYESGIQAAERAMATNDEFRARVEAGESIGAASKSLGRDEMRPMLFWVTGVSYYFKECLTGPGRAVSFRWMMRTKELMDRMLALDPGFERGAVLFSLAIYHIAAPPGAGRDLDLAADYFERAIEAGPSSLLVRWGRAKYFHVKTGDRDAFRSDLEWVLAQDPHAASSMYAWNVYFQRDARTMLGAIDETFR